MRRDRKIYVRLTGFFVGFVGLAVILASLFRFTTSGPEKSPEETGRLAGNSRGPASVLYDEEGEAVFWDQSLTDVERGSNDADFGGTSLPASAHADVFSRPGGGGFLSAGEATRRTGIKASRARISPFNVRAFAKAVTGLEVNSRQRLVKLSLFEDTQLKLRLERPALNSTNDGVYWGRVEGDPSSRVRMFVAEGKMNATVETHGHIYRIVDAAQGSDHFIIEEEISKHPQ